MKSKYQLRAVSKIMVLIFFILLKYSNGRELDLSNTILLKGTSYEITLVNDNTGAVKIINEKDYGKSIYVDIRHFYV